MSDNEAQATSRSGPLSFVRGVGRGVDGIARILSALGGLIIMGLMVLIVADVAMRAIAGRPLPGTIGLSQVAVAVAIYLAFAYTHRTGSNIRVDLVVMRVKGTPRKFLEALNRIIVVLGSVFVAWYAITPARRSVRVNEHWVGAFINVPMWPARWALVIGAAALALVAVRVLFVWDDGDGDSDDEEIF